jgi:hypothetical protein
MKTPVLLITSNIFQTPSGKLSRDPAQPLFREWRLSELTTPPLGDCCRCTYNPLWKTRREIGFYVAEKHHSGMV